MKKIIMLGAGLLFLSSCKTSDSRLKLDSPITKDLSNYSGSVVCPNLQYVEARTVADIQEIVRIALSQGKTIRAVSIDNPRSYSPVICAKNNGIVVNVKAFNKILSVDASTKTAWIGPGILINELNDQLASKNLTFPVTPDYNGITVAGGMGTGAHHSSLQIPSAIGDWVEEVKVVDGLGNLRTIKGAELDVSRVHLGLMGIIYEMKIRVLDMYKLQYGFDNQDRSDADLEATFINRVSKYMYSRILWFPSQKKYIADYFKKVDVSTKGDSYNNLWTSTPDISWLGGFPIDTLNSNQTVQCTAENLRAKTFAGPFQVVNSSSSNPVGFAHKMIAGTCDPGACSWDKGVSTRTVEVGMPLSRAAEWMGDIRKLISKRKACFPILGIYLRFSKASTAAIGQAGGQDTMVFEIHIPQGSSSDLEPSSDVYDEMVQMTIQKYNGRPHWGKNNMQYFTNLDSKNYPRMAEFEAMRKKIDPENVFLNPFWEDIQNKTQVVNYPGCGAKHACICKQDSDCGRKDKCEAGALLTNIKVCRRNRGIF